LFNTQNILYYLLIRHRNDLKIVTLKY